MHQMLLVFGINDGCDQLENLRDRVWVEEFKLKGRLGRGTIKNELRGKINRELDYGNIGFCVLFRINYRHMSIPGTSS